ncbi:hypothetical protein L596_021530 [Steinernema carpocapsae]|uniref:SANT domain-containing protein n=1 Tax=Steinernema carpocapsae TaxID=34508 RepID=A0A4U5MJ19_STECR|nr:hypothetical protein L596_021530 [Steinernema carpocapsae]
MQITKVSGIKEEEPASTSEVATKTRKRKIQCLPRETLVYHPYHDLTDRDIDQFLIVARAVGTFSRALDSSSNSKLPTLHMTAAAASRDVTLFHAMALLHQAEYDIGKATKFLVPPPSKSHYPLDADKATTHNTVSLGGPILCRDQMEEWTASEANLFEEALDKYGKDFVDMRNDYLPWKSLRDIVEYYYMWKTTNRYVEASKTKAAEQESKLKQVYIPNYNKPNPNLVGPPNPKNEKTKSPSPCESCQSDEHAQWYGWGPAQRAFRLCGSCWVTWKKNAGLKRAHQYEKYDLGNVSNDMLVTTVATTSTTSTTSQSASSSHTCNPSSSTGITNAATPAQTAALAAGLLAKGNANQAMIAALQNLTKTAGLGGKNNNNINFKALKNLPTTHPLAQQLAAVLAAHHQQTQAALSSGASGSNVASSSHASAAQQAAQVAVSAKSQPRVAFYLHTTLMTKVARRVAPKNLLNVRKASRSPFIAIDGTAVKQFCQTREPAEIGRVIKICKPKLSPSLVETHLRLHASTLAQLHKTHATPSK